jgi:hypothetical protein
MGSKNAYKILITDLNVDMRISDEQLMKWVEVDKDKIYWQGDSNDPSVSITIEDFQKVLELITFCTPGFSVLWPWTALSQDWSDSSCIAHQM